MNWYWYIPIACVAWTLGWFAFYFAFIAKGDSSGDVGLGVFAISIVYAWPFIWAYGWIRDMIWPPPPPLTQEELAEQTKVFMDEFNAKMAIHETMIEAWDKEQDPARRKKLYDEICRFEANWNRDAGSP